MSPKPSRIPQIPPPAPSPPAAQIRIRALARRLNAAVTDGMQWEEQCYIRDEQIVALKAEVEQLKGESPSTAMLPALPLP